MNFAQKVDFNSKQFFSKITISVQNFNFVPSFGFCQFYFWQNLEIFLKE